MKDKFTVIRSGKVKVLQPGAHTGCCEGGGVSDIEMKKLLKDFYFYLIF